jgi:CRP-like cAMP-binding protein
MSETGIKEILGRSLIFYALTESELERLASQAIERTLGAGEFVFWEGDKSDRFYIVASGRIKVLKHSSLGREFIVAFFSPGEMFGEVAVFEDKPYPASAQAVIESRILGINKDNFLSFLSQHPQVALRIINVLGGRLRDAQNRLRDIAGERVEQRLARILLMLSGRLGSSLPFTRQEIAEMAGTTTETTIRALSRLKEGGIIRSTRGKIIISDKVKLKLLADGPPDINSPDW